MLLKLGKWLAHWLYAGYVSLQERRDEVDKGKVVCYLASKAVPREEGDILWMLSLLDLQILKAIILLYSV